MNKSIKKFLSRVGRKGGKSKSEKKLKAARANVKKAREVRLDKIKNPFKLPPLPDGWDTKIPDEINPPPTSNKNKIDTDIP